MPDRAVLSHAPSAIIDTPGFAPNEVFGEGRYSRVASEPTHAGKFRDAAGQWYELVGRFVLPDQFVRTGDVDDAASFQRASDYMAVRGVTTLCLAPRSYDMSSAAVSFNNPVYMLGAGFSELGPKGGGSWIKCGRTSNRAFKFSNPKVRGDRIDRIGFHQDHPAIAPGWRPTPHDYVIENVNAYGGLELGDFFFHGVNKGVL